MSAIKDFRDFILRGNVVDLAVGIVIGAAFGTVVTKFVSDLLTPLIQAIYGGKGNFSGASFVIRGSTFLPGDFINAVISFVIVAAVVFFFVVRPVNALMARAKKAPPADPTDRECPYCLSVIPIKASKCKYCASEVPAVAAAVPVGADGQAAE